MHFCANPSTDKTLKQRHYNFMQLQSASAMIWITIIYRATPSLGWPFLSPHGQKREINWRRNNDTIFYLDRFSRIQVNAKANGWQGASKGTRLSLGVYLMNGEYDEEL